MKPLYFHYFPDTDTLYIELTEGEADGVTEVDERTLLDVDENERVIGITIEHASEHLDPEVLVQHVWNEAEPADITEPKRFSTAETARLMARSTQWVQAAALAHGIGQVRPTAGRGQREFTGADLVELRKHIKYKKPQNEGTPVPVGG